MRGKSVITSLKKKLRITADSALAARLGITGQGLRNWKQRDKVTPRQTAELISRTLKIGGLQGDDAIRAIKKKFRVTTDRSLAQRLGITGQAVRNWKNRKQVTARQLSEMVARAAKGGAADLQRKAIRPIVEFFPITKSASKQGAKYELFAMTSHGKANPYALALRSELKESRGVYIFFDSRGRAVYAGKARRQGIWSEMKGAFNRERGDIQTVKRVRHPTRRQEYRSSNEKARQIREHTVPLHELAAYFSVYEVEDSMINELEAMLVRSFANDLLNKRMERFTQQKSVRRLRR